MLKCLTHILGPLSAWAPHLKGGGCMAAAPGERGELTPCVVVLDDAHAQAAPLRSTACCAVPLALGPTGSSWHWTAAWSNMPRQCITSRFVGGDVACIVLAAGRRWLGPVMGASKLARPALVCGPVLAAGLGPVSDQLGPQPCGTV